MGRAESRQGICTGWLDRISADIMKKCPPGSDRGLQNMENLEGKLAELSITTNLPEVNA